MPSRRLAPVFASILAAVACGPRIDEDDFEDHCSEPRLANVTFAASIDGAELRTGTAPAERFGELCSRASARDACLAEVARVSEMGSRTPLLVATSGDEVLAAARSPTTLGRILGPIESANEARLAAHVARATNACRVRAAGKDFEVYGTRSGDNCGSEVAFVLRVFSDGTVREVDTETLDEGDDSCSIGRRPAGLRDGAKQRGVGGWFADVARLEAASVVAFERLAEELAAHGAPRSLVRRALSAANDERRHTRMMASLARRHGGRMQSPRIGPARRRSLEAMALENAREGCVRESYGALVATWQAREATDRAIARAMAVIADDETRHAELSWDVAAFLDEHLSPRARARIERERESTASELVAGAERGPEPMLVELAGMPRARDARNLTRAFVRTLLA